MNFLIITHTCTVASYNSSMHQKWRGQFRIWMMTSSIHMSATGFTRLTLWVIPDITPLSAASSATVRWYLCTYSLHCDSTRSTHAVSSTALPMSWLLHCIWSPTLVPFIRKRDTQSPSLPITKHTMHLYMPLLMIRSSLSDLDYSPSAQLISYSITQSKCACIRTTMSQRTELSLQTASPKHITFSSNSNTKLSRFAFSSNNIDSND